MSRHIPIGEAKARFAECVRRAENGEEVVLSRHGRPVARLVAVAQEGTRPLGMELREPETPYGAGTPAIPRSARTRREAIARLLAEEVWPRVPKELLGRGVDKEERERILGLDEDGG